MQQNDVISNLFIVCYSLRMKNISIVICDAHFETVAYASRRIVAATNALVSRIKVRWQGTMRICCSCVTQTNASYRTTTAQYYRTACIC